MTIRIHFTLEDLARTRVSDAPFALFELELAARTLQARDQSARLDPWRHKARAAITTPQARMALSLMPAIGSTPDFVSPTQAGSLEELLDQVRATPRHRIKTELADAAHHSRPPAWTSHLAHDGALFQELCTGLHELYQALLGPLWPRLSAHFIADKTLRAHHLLAGGVERLLADANPQWMRWQPPMLKVRTANGADYDLHLQGDGLTLVPSAFVTRTIVVSPAPFFVTYPALHNHPLRWMTAVTPQPAHDAAPGAHVSMLLGRTRAAVLNTVAEHPGCTTKQLATLTGLAPASASEHATILREAGLISTLRYRNSALHSPTTLGLALLNARHEPA
ncbi:MAG: winged helix-turn-helix transcriptional regulator [Catenulispora sp.]|nr:winged helix-turn-helix transcriptional regulator [Catenulispora sp.]